MPLCPAPPSFFFFPSMSAFAAFPPWPSASPPRARVFREWPCLCCFALPLHCHCHLGGGGGGGEGGRSRGRHGQTATSGIGRRRRLGAARAPPHAHTTGTHLDTTVATGKGTRGWGWEEGGKGDGGARGLSCVLFVRFQAFCLAPHLPSQLEARRRLCRPPPCLSPLSLSALCLVAPLWLPTSAVARCFPSLGSVNTLTP